MSKGIGRRLLGIAFALTALSLAPHALASEALLPIVFVHGSAGSAAQYASVAKRMVSNGYPAHLIRAFEYDSSSGPAVIGAPAALDAFVDHLRTELGVARVNLVGHSLGTTVSTTYLSVPARAAKIAHYVGVDGRSIADCKALDPGLECLGIFRGSAGAVGPNNVYFNGTQSHVEAATSQESFAAQYQFFTGRAPQTTLILPEPPGQVEIAGRAVNFPQNTGVDGGTLLIWQIDPRTGHRVDAEPEAAIEIGADGAWGPIPVNGQQHYEFELLRPDSATALHAYFQPFIRSDLWIRLLSAPPGSATLVNTATGPNHAAAVIIRNREWWTTHPGGPADAIEIATASASRGVQAPVNALQNVISDGIAVGQSAIGVHVHDNPTDQFSSLAPIPFFGSVSFQNGADVYMPAAEPPDGTITFSIIPRGDVFRPQVVNTPNWTSDRHRISINANDYVQDINSWGECKRAKPSPCK